MARKAPGAVGIWHETFLVDRAETVYVSIKPMGLPKATELVEVGKRQDRAQARFAERQTAVVNSTTSHRSGELRIGEAHLYCGQHPAQRGVATR
ncbi:DUF4188 domain-containing protein [Microbacterium sp. LWH11-1.2]